MNDAIGECVPTCVDDTSCPSEYICHEKYKVTYF